MIAATALVRNLTVVTRNPPDFTGFSVPLSDPFATCSRNQLNSALHEGSDASVGVTTWRSLKPAMSMLEMRAEYPLPRESRAWLSR